MVAVTIPSPRSRASWTTAEVQRAPFVKSGAARAWWTDMLDGRDPEAGLRRILVSMRSSSERSAGADREGRCI